MSRRFTAPDGTIWDVSVASHGQTSGYLNPRVHRPIVEFRPAGPGAVRYAALPRDVLDLETLDDEGLVRLLQRARVY